MRAIKGLWLLLFLATIPTKSAAQSFPTDDQILRQIWDEGMNRSQVYELSQTLNDSIGPRLTGSPHLTAGSDWVIGKYTSWGVPARQEQYGTWLGWNRGPSSLSLVQPHVRSMNAMALAWSPSTPNGEPIEAPVVLLPDLPDSAAFAAWMPEVAGKFVAISFPQPTCRPDAAWEEYAQPSGMGGMMARLMGGGERGNVFTRMRDERQAAEAAWRTRIENTGFDSRTLPDALERAGAVGILSSEWPNGYGAHRIFQARTDEVPSFGMSCEDYGIVARLAANNQGPVLRAQAESEFLGDQPALNTIAEVRGSELPDEYVVMSAHFDTWDGGTGGGDNNTGTIIMMEAMRILRSVYPQPKRSIVVGHWNSEEQGLNGSGAYATDHPEVLEGIQAVFNLDMGTGRVNGVSAMGLLGTGEFLGRWAAQLPDEVNRSLQISVPGNPSSGGSDHASFACAGAPAFSLSQDPWDYFSYTWHTNLDTFDKVVIENVQWNAVLTAMLVYLAADDPETMPRDRRIPGLDRRTGQPGTWPECRAPQRRGPGGE